MADSAHEQHAAARDFWLHLALNHDVMPETHGDTLIYSGSSPDETSLVWAVSLLYGHVVSVYTWLFAFPRRCDRTPPTHPRHPTHTKPLRSRPSTTASPSRRASRAR